MLVLRRQRVRIRGVVQGVGFRPHVYLLALHHGVTGWISNDSLGVLAELQCDNPTAFLEQLRQSPPPLAHIESVETSDLAPDLSETRFEIRESHALSGESTAVSPDIATCDDCLRELFDPNDRRYRYPFLNCTHCGPRFTIIRDLPYDRPLTTMADFPLCADCEREYRDPANRRFHAQPIACPACGPRLFLHPTGEVREDALQAARRLLKEGLIVAIKGIGGFHLACDATNAQAVATLRQRKGRGAGKPLAVMVRELPGANSFLTSRERPIVLIDHQDLGLADNVAPGQSHWGLFLPYSPLHHLLLEGDMPPLVMTSGNRSEEPIVRDNAEALERLSSIADAFLLHDREIHVVCDDSVIQSGGTPIRRSRGYAPLPVRLPLETPPILAVGGELKATFCLAKGHHAYCSQHVGDMENLETMHAFERALEQMQRLFRIPMPETVVCDLHPGYLSTAWAKRYAEAHGIPCIGIQHHHAHATSLMAEHGLPADASIITVAFDGTGYGTDGAIWGGEFLHSTYASSQRLGHLRYVPLPGGDAAIRKPYRAAFAHLRAAGIDHPLPIPEPERRILHRQLEQNLNCPLTSSAGRLFDAAASILGIRHEATYEAQGAMELEALARLDHSQRELDDATIDDSFIIDPAPLWKSLLANPSPAAFHRSIARTIAQACLKARDRTGVETIGLTGGVFQNALLLELTLAELQRMGFEKILTHRLVPPNDGGLSLGQAASAMKLLEHSRHRTNR